MSHVFVLSLPRSRTAWLTMYLQGAGIKASHDEWKYAHNAQELRLIMEYRGTVVNVDSTNILFYDEIREEFPDAKFIKIIRNVEDVKRSLNESYGEAEDFSIVRYSEILNKIEAGITVYYDDWTPKITSEIYRFITGEYPKDISWLFQSDEFKVTVTDQRIKDDIWYGKSGWLDHIVNKLRG